MMLRTLSTVLAGTAAHAAEPEPVDAEFLEYLATVEGKDENWTVVASKKERKKAATPPVIAKPESPPPEPAKQQEVKR